VQFTDGEVDGVDHGEKGTVPDGWTDLFDFSDDDEQDDGGDEADEDDEPTDAPDEPEESDSDESEASERGRLRKALTDDVRHLWGGA
jgi:hypothetical protein